MKSTLGFCLAIFLMPALFAAPKGFKPHKGTASASQEGHRTLVRSGQKAIIHWDQFSIESGELVHFHQKDATSRVLNRVMGKDASRIYGRLTSNGQVFLINPQGIYIGPSGRIETNGFVGSTLNLLDQDFWEGKDLFFHEPGSGLIKNLGVISCPAGDIVLIARAIENEGTINSPSGLTACGSGVEVLLKPDGDQRISIRPDLSLPNDENEIAIQNYGDIEALAVEMKTSKNPYEKAIHCSGAVTAFRQKEEGGRIYLVGNHGKTVVEGSLEARSGTVHILGKEVSVVDEAVIDVSGSTGGTLLVGGDYQGKNPNILNAQTTTVSKDASMYADGFEGDGGRIIVWSDGETFCGAEMSACARGNQGDGGFIEISGAKSVASPTHPDLRAKNGKDGTLLLDAGPITISSGGASGPTAYGSTFINAQLGLGNFSLDTGSEPGPGEQSLTVDGTVTGADEITWANANKLTLIGGRNVEIQSGAAIRATGSGDLEIQGNGTFVALTDFNGIFVNGGTLEVANGAMTLTGTGGQASFNRGILVNNSGVVQATGSGSISMTGTATLTGGVQNKEGVSIGTMGPSIGTVQVNNGNLTILGRGGDGFLSQGVEINFGGVIRSTGSGNISITGFGGNTTGNFSNGFVIGTATIEATGTGSITINGTGEGTGFRSIGVERFPEAFAPGNGIIQTESGNITINATGAVNGGVDCPGLSLQGPTSGSGIVRTNAGGNIIINATGGGNNSSPGVSITRGTISTTGGGDITINATGGGGNASDGVQIVGPAPAAGNSAIQTIGLPGDIFITATGGSSGTGNNGVNVINGGQIFAGDGIIVIDGTGGPNGGGSYGVSVTGSGSDITARFGTFDVTGRAGGGGSEGILVSGGGVITALNGSGVINTFSDLIVSNGSSISASGGTLTVNVARDILLENGGSLSSQLQNNVRAGRDITLNGMLGLGATIFSSTSDIQVLAGRNFTMNAAVNFAAFVGALGNITIVVDNAFPSPPDIGPGSFSKDANSVILANIDGSNNLRIFTARQSQNNIQGTLNLFPFVPGIEFVNTNQEQWETYFPSGFGGNPFTIFYKNTNRQTIITLINELMVANAQISDFLPFFPRVRTPFEFSYVGEFCDYDPADHHLHCRPNFAPYGSFIFEDRVFWIGRSWDPSSQTTLMDYLKHRK